MVFVTFQGQHWYTLQRNRKIRGNSKLVLRTVIGKYYSKVKEMKCIIVEFIFYLYILINISTDVSLRVFEIND